MGVLAIARYPVEAMLGELLRTATVERGSEEVARVVASLSA